jgi:hypothetical protein
MRCADSSSPSVPVFRPKRGRFGVLCTVLLTLGRAIGADPTAEQQYWLELTNRFRTDPQAELEKLVNFSSPGVWGAPKSDDPSIAYALNFFGTSAADLAAQFSSLAAAPPVAWNSALNVSATDYSNLMVTSDQQSHTLDGSASISALKTAATARTGWRSAKTFLPARSRSFMATGVLSSTGVMAMEPRQAYGNGIQNPAGHRDVLIHSLIKEIGIGFQDIAIPGSNVAAVGPYVVTQHFATEFRFDGSTYFADAILTGSVYQDTIAADLFYTPGEGLAGATIHVYEDVSGILVASGFSNSAGGFNIALTGLTDGVVYRVEAPDTGLAAQTFTLNAHTEDYGAPVIFYDNVYSSFMMVPEPGGLLLCLVAAIPLLGFRSRRSVC